MQEENPYEIAIEELRQVVTMTCPLDKLECAGEVILLPSANSLIRQPQRFGQTSELTELLPLYYVTPYHTERWQFIYGRITRGWMSYLFFPVSV